jgi:hypothetical protein
VLEFPRRIQRIDVDGYKSGTKDAAHCDRVLQNIGQHDGDTFAAHQSQCLLQVTGKRHRQFVELSIA